MPLLLSLICLPLVEIALFIVVGGAIGLWATLALVIASSLAGIAVMRGHGTRSLARLQQSLEQGGDPTGPLAHGALLMIAGVLLFVPGFFTSACGLLLLVPPIRRWLIGRGAARMTGRMTVRATSLRRPGARPGPAAQPRPRPGTIDAEYEVIEEHEAEEAPERPGTSGWTRPH